MTSQSPDVMDCSVSALRLALGHQTRTFTRPLLPPPARQPARDRAASSYLGGGHGYVEKLAPASLRDGAGEKQLQAVFGKQRLLVLTSQHALAFSDAARWRGIAGGAGRSSHLSDEPSLALVLVFLRDKRRR